MGLISGLLTLPLAPVRGTAWVAERLLEQAEAEFYDERAIRAQLLDIEAPATRARSTKRTRLAPRTSCSNGCSRRGAEEVAMTDTSRNGNGNGDGALSALQLTKSARNTIEDLTGFAPGVGQRHAVGR